MSDTKDPPSLPQIVDEAGDSPSWLPMVGFLLFCALGLLIAAHRATHTAESGSTVESDEAAGEQPSAPPSPAEPAH